MKFKELKQIAKKQGRGLFYKKNWLDSEYKNADDFSSIDDVEVTNTDEEKISEKEYSFSGWFFITNNRKLKEVTLEILK